MRRLPFLLLIVALLSLAAPAALVAAPLVGPPEVSFVQGSRVTSTGIKVRVDWPAASGKVSRYQLQQRVDGGSWQNVTLAHSKARSTSLRVDPWALHRFRVRAFDPNGNAGAWAATPRHWLGVAQEDEPAIAYSSGWAAQKDSLAYGGSRSTSATANTSARFTFSGTHIAWVAQRAPKRGRAAVHVDGELVATVDLYASTKSSRRLVLALSWSSEASRTVEITTEGTSGRPYVDVDAFLTMSAPRTETLVGAGDIGYCGALDVAATAALIEGVPGVAVTLGDNAYPDGTPEQLAECYDPHWGRFKSRTRPSPGNHDYRVAGAKPYFDYFGSAAGPAGKGWYTYQAGTWRVYSLNSECNQIGGCGPGSPQYEWLERDLQQSPQHCVLAYWHRPVFSSIHHGGSTHMAAIAELLYKHRAEVVLASHDHGYERFAPLEPDGDRNGRRGIRHFVVGTGGAPLYDFDNPPHRGTIVRNNTTHGVLRVDLSIGGYAWRFLPTVDGGFTDSGSSSCR